MTPRRLFDLVLSIAVGAAIVVGLLFGVRALAGRTGMGLPAVDAVFVPQDWFSPTNVRLIDDTTVELEGVVAVPGEPQGAQELVVSGATLLLWEGATESYPLASDGEVRVRHTFSGGGGLSRPVGWRVVRVEHRAGGVPTGAAYVLVDLTKLVWLKRTGPVEWRTLPIEQ
ncbi:MAG: hypothetical protein QMD96_00400 [Anaerosomatales bacterium]|nr:hypothetical protein [Anaerosomatales bacterium]